MIFHYSTIFVAVVMSVLQNLMRKKMEEVPEIQTKQQVWYFRLLPFALLAVAVWLPLADGELDILAAWRALMMLSMLWMIAYIDYREHLIPNRALLIALVMRAVVFVCEMAMDASDALTEIAGELIVCLVLLAFCWLLRFLSRKGIGMGDVKLFAVLPLFFGPMGSLRVTMYALIIIFVQSCFCLILKKKGRKDVLPFAPAASGGAWIYVILSVFL